MANGGDELEQTIAEFVFRAKTAPAGGFERACAFFIDCIPVELAAWLLSAFLSAATAVPPRGFPSVVVRSFSFAFAFWLWGAVWESSRFQATPGKMALGLRVATADRGIRMEFGRSAARSFFKLLPAAKSLALGAALLAVGAFASDSPRLRLGPETVRRLLPFVALAVCCVPLVPDWGGSAWRHGRRYAHDRLARTLVRAPLRARWFHVVAEIAVACAAAIFLFFAVASPVRSLARLHPVQTRGEVRSRLGALFEARFSSSPMRVTGIRVALPSDTAPCIGSMMFATNCTGAIRLSRSGDSSEIPFAAWMERGEWKAEFTGDVSAVFRKLLVAREKTPETSPISPAAPSGPTRPVPLRPGERTSSVSGLEIRFEAAELMEWPDDARPKLAPFLLALDFVVFNRSGDDRFVADWDAKVSVSGKPAKQAWLDSFKPIQGRIETSAGISGTVLFALQNAPGEIKGSWLGCDFAAEFPGRKPGMGK